MRRRASYWIVLVGSTLFITLEPALFLVVLALALSAAVLICMLLLLRALLSAVFVAPPR